jgi:hypothetical protein
MKRREAVQRKVLHTGLGGQKSQEVSELSNGYVTQFVVRDSSNLIVIYLLIKNPIMSQFTLDIFEPK